MKSEDAAGCLVLFGVLFFFLLFGFLCYCSGEKAERESWRKECVERGFAEYNEKTAEWQWKNSDAKPPVE